MAYSNNNSLEYEKVRSCIRCGENISKHIYSMSACEYKKRKYCGLDCANKHKIDTTILTPEQTEALREELRYV